MDNQNFTSANTSINGKKLPTLYKKVDFGWIATCGGISVFDYGCGKYNNGCEFITDEIGGLWYGYDPYNRTRQENGQSLISVYTEGVDCVLCANVLNVIDSDTAVQQAVDKITHIPAAFAPDRYAPYFVAVYEGDKTGNGHETKPDCYQRNEKTAKYLRFFPENAVLTHGVITNRPDCVK